MKQNEGGKEHKAWGVNVEQRFHFSLVSSAHLSGTFEKKEKRKEKKTVWWLI